MGRRARSRRARYPGIGGPWIVELAAFGQKIMSVGAASYRDALHEALNALGRGGILERREEPDVQYRWRANVDTQL